MEYAEKLFKRNRDKLLLIHKNLRCSIYIQKDDNCLISTFFVQTSNLKYKIVKFLEGKCSAEIGNIPQSAKKFFKNLEIINQKIN